MRSIGVRNAVVTVVEKQDIAGLKALDPAADAGGGLGVPVIGGAGPHHDSRKAGFGDGSVKLRAAETEWRTDATAVPRRGGEDSVLASSQFIDDATAAEEEQARMPVCVVTKAVTRGNDLRSQ